MGNIGISENNSTVAYFTLGCKLNFAETSTIGKMMQERGMRSAQAGDIPDICVINTCSVTELADKKCRQTIRKIIHQYPDATIIVTGCYAQLKPNDIAKIDGVDIVLGSDQKMDIMNYLDKWNAEHIQTVANTPGKDIRKFAPSCAKGDRTRYFLKVQDGCDYYCTYCTIPIARGRSRSGSIEQMVEQARNVAAEGGKEIVITGVNIGEFGKGREDNFYDLLRALDEVEGIERYRISSIEPNLLTDEIIDLVAQSKHIMPHFHIPLQAGSDEVLRLMHRHYDTALFRHKIETVRHAIPDAFIGIDLMVGARGETDECFENGYNFVKSLDITRMHVFTYSERPGTKALEIPYVVDANLKNRRTHRMMQLSEQKLHDYYARHIGTERMVLWEQPQKGKPMHGFTDNYIRVEAEYRAGYINQVKPVILSGFAEDNETMIGKHIQL